jgi:molybdate transport system substrate-binding protein
MGERKGALVSIVLAVVVAGCSGGNPGASSTSPARARPATSSLSGSITVMAPAPLKAALDKAKAAFEGTHTGVTVTVNYGHVPTLLTQISQGVPADVLVTPDEMTMKQVQTKGVAGSGTAAVARNKLVLVVPAANPGQVKDATSLGDASLSVVVCAADLPCGKLTSALATKAGVTLAADSLEPGGSPGVVTKVAAGEADLGVCFATDTKAAGAKVAVIPLPDTLGASTTVTAAMLNSPANPATAKPFLDFLGSTEGRAVFTAEGFAAL